MSGEAEVRTARLLLRPLRDDDLDAFAALHADPRMMRLLAGSLSRAQSEAALSRIRDAARTHGFAPWAVEEQGRSGLVGLIGLSWSKDEIPASPCVEIAWRLAPEVWGKGYATEAARATLDYGFETLSMPEILAWTVPHNAASRRVMEKLGMTHDPSEDFDHPRLPEGHELRRHVLYRISRRPAPASAR